MSTERLAASRKQEINGVTAATIKTGGTTDTATGRGTTSRSSGDPSSSTSRSAAAGNLSVTIQEPEGSRKDDSLQGCDEDNPNHLVYKKMEAVIRQMQDEHKGVSVRDVKSFMSRIPSVFTGSDVVAWIVKHQHVDDQAEALHMANQMAAHGYIFPIDDHVLTVKNDGNFYRFQTPYFWPSKSWEPENTDYAVYLCKRTMHNKARLELADYEAENLARLQKIFSRKWEFIFMQAEAQTKVDKKRDKLERKILDSQERAFWDVHRPVPGSVNTTELDIKKACRTHKRPIGRAVAAACGHLPTVSDIASYSSTVNSGHNTSSDIYDLKSELTRVAASLRAKIERSSLRLSKIAETLISCNEQYREYDPLLSALEYPNPWTSDSTELWDVEKSGKDISPRRVRRWAFSINELLRDPIGREQFLRFLDKEFSSENLRFYLALQDLRKVPQSEVVERVKEIWSEFLSADASAPVNIDSRSYEITKENMQHPHRWTFDTAGAHLFHLMRSDPYSRYVRSDMYKDFLAGAKKKVSTRGIRAIVPFPNKKEAVSSG